MDLRERGSANSIRRVEGSANSGRRVREKGSANKGPEGEGVDQ